MVKRLMVFLLVVCLMFMVFGCSGGKKAATEDPGNGAPVDQPEEDPLDEPAGLNAFYEIERIQDVVLSFKELGYSFSDATSMLIVDYKFIGQDNVDGTSADHISITFDHDNDTTIAEIWMDKSGNILKASFDGEELGPMEAPMAEMFVMVVVMPFTMYAGGWEDAFLDNDGYEQLGWVASKRTKENRDFGAGTSTVHQYVFKVKSFVDNSDLEYKFEVAEISGKSMFVGWEVEIDKENSTTFKVEKVVPR